MKPERVDPNPEHPHTSEASGGTGELKIQHFLQRLVRRPKYTFSYTQNILPSNVGFPTEAVGSDTTHRLGAQPPHTHTHTCAHTRAHTYTHAPVTHPKCLNSWFTRSQSGFPTFPSSGPGKHLACYYSFTTESTTNEQSIDRRQIGQSI